MKYVFQKLCLLFTSFFICTFCAVNKTAAKPSFITFINSDNSRHTKNNIYCNGNVIIIYSNKIISANEVIYDKINEYIYAKGNVIIKDERQNTYFFDSLSVNKNFSSGKGENIKIIMSDKSRLAATKCVIKNEKYEMQNTIYTPCYKCTEFGELTWQVKSHYTVFNPKENAEHQDAQFEFLGIPIFYTPYLSHASPNVKRKSGFIAFRSSASDISGFCISPQYLCSISESQEIILKPIITSKIGHVGWMYYRFRFPNGEFDIDTSITNIKSVKNQSVNEQTIKEIQDSGYRGHLFSKMMYEINNIWRCRFDINLYSDKYYPIKFPFLKKFDRALYNDIKLEGFDGQNYTSAKAVMFQNEKRSSCIPRVLPMLERNYSTNLLFGTFNIDSYFVNLDFQDKRSSQKFISNASFKKTILLPFGNLIHIKESLFLSGMKVSEANRSEYNSSLYIIPQANFMWEWPLVFATDIMNTICTPILGVIVAGNKKNIDIFEEPFCEITDWNFNSGNKSISFYNIDSGSRVYYGLKLAGYNVLRNIYHFSIGRSTELTKPQNKLEPTGLKYKNSHIVTSADIALSDALVLVANGNYSTQSKRWVKTELGLNFFNEVISFDAMAFNGRQCSYNPFAFKQNKLNKQSEKQNTQRYKGIMLDIGLNITKSIKLKGGVTIGNKINGTDTKLINHNTGIEYKNECITADFTVERRNYRYGDLKPETVFSFFVHMKNL